MSEDTACRGFIKLRRFESFLYTDIIFAEHYNPKRKAFSSIMHSALCILHYSVLPT